MIDKSLGVRPLGKTLFISRHRGFSLVEVMMSIVLIAIGLALALPSYRDMIEKRQVTHGAEQVASFINSVQGIAMKTNQTITVSYSLTDTNDWCIGAVAGDTACDCEQTSAEASDYCEIDAQAFVLNHGAASDRKIMYSMTGDGAYAFDPIRGIFTDLDDSLTMEMRSASQDYRLSLVVNNTGRAMLCSNSSSHAVPGYDPCPQPVLLVEAES